jgi:uncharacterized membrane protein
VIEPSRSGVLERVVFFSDAVFAIAITLLVIQLPTPVLDALRPDQSLADALGGLIGHVFAFAMGFFVIGSYWVGHLRLLHSVARTDLRLIWLNLGFLLWIVLVPFVSDTLGANPLSRGTVILFALVQVAAGIFQIALWLYINRHPELAVAPIPPAIARNVTLQLVLAPVIFGLSVPVALILGAVPGAWSWAIIGVVTVVITRLYPARHTPL